MEETYGQEKDGMIAEFGIWEAVGQFGLAVALVIVFVIRDIKRDRDREEERRENQKFQQETLLALVQDGISTIKANQKVMETSNKILEKFLDK